MNDWLYTQAARRAIAGKDLLRLGVALGALAWTAPGWAQVAQPEGSQVAPAVDVQKTPEENVKDAAAAQAETGNAAGGEVVVTGTRIVSSGANSPTPLTVVSTEQLLQTTPSNIPDGLNKLPVFLGSSQPRRSGDGSSNGAQNVLNLRNFGAQRTLVLVDGHRVAPSNPNGTTDVDTLPQMLVSRVDVVTGGASAVYGSDAVTGVVNFVLDHKLQGVKVEANAGVSEYGDGASYKAGIAAGTKVFGDRGHLEASFRHQQTDPIANFGRPYGPGLYVLTGSGTTASPFTVTPNTRRADSAFGGKIAACTSPCSVLNQQFVTDGVIGPFNAGTPSLTSNQNSGGDGAYSPYTTAAVASRFNEGYGRFDYEVTNHINFYVDGSLSEAVTEGTWFPVKLTPGNGQASTFFKNNPFLSATAQRQLGNNGLSNSTNTFQLGSYIVNNGPETSTGSRNDNKYWSVSTGLNGVLGRFNWDIYYTHGDNELNVQSRNNSNYQKQFAALDAVVGANGQIQCYAATQAATAAQYAGCVPLNAFGPTAITQQMLNWFTSTTQFTATNILDDVTGSVTGDAFKLWAGPIKFAISGEARWNKYKVVSSDSPTSLVDCTGLRICNASLQLWAQPVLANVDVGNNVWEVAGELAIPLIKDVPVFKSVDVSLAGRHTDYSTSGPVNTWKVGVDWRLFDFIRLRGTASRDIRAPNLNDLYQPVQRSVAGFVDLHTGISGSVFNQTQGNPDLKPEVARTYTAGAVLTPGFLRGFNLSVDYYQITLNNAIGTIAASSNTVQRLCEDSGGTSIYCTTIVRPLPFSDRSAANFPTRTYTFGLNTAFTQVKGWDLEANYRFHAAHGDWNARLFANVQPTNFSQLFPNAPITQIIAPKTRITGILGYDLGGVDFIAEDHWLSHYSQVTTAGQVWVQPEVHAFNVLDLTAEVKLPLAGRAPMTMFFNVQNALNAQPQIVPQAGSIGLYYPVPNFEDLIGRFFTVGFRAKF